MFSAHLAGAARGRPKPATPHLNMDWCVLGSHRHGFPFARTSSSMCSTPQENMLQVVVDSVRIANSLKQMEASNGYPPKGRTPRSRLLLVQLDLFGLKVNASDLRGEASLTNGALDTRNAAFLLPSGPIRTLWRGRGLHQLVLFLD